MVEIGDLIASAGDLEDQYVVLDVVEGEVFARRYPRGPRASTTIPLIHFERGDWIVLEITHRFQIGDILTSFNEPHFRVEVIGLQGDGYRARFLTGPAREATLTFAEASGCTRVAKKRRRNLEL